MMVSELFPICCSSAYTPYDIYSFLFLLSLVFGTQFPCSFILYIYIFTAASLSACLVRNDSWLTAL